MEYYKCACGWSGWNTELLSGARDERGRYIREPWLHNDDMCPECHASVFDLEVVERCPDCGELPCECEDELRKATEEWHEYGTIAPSCVGCPTAEEFLKRREEQN